ncbi:MAG TPA: hypothetical protein VF133_04190 [Terriglobales bacterium]|jgi:hypothetical protein
MQFEHELLIEALRAELHLLDDFQRVAQNDVHTLRLKRHLRERIAALEDQNSPQGFHEAAA